MAPVAVWMEVEAQQYDPVASKLVFEQVVKPLMMKMKPDSAVVEENQKKLGQVLDVYDSTLFLWYQFGNHLQLCRSIQWKMPLVLIVKTQPNPHGRGLNFRD
ncbi:hypothetical protein NE237_019988 [Protea cynaroides]|uniref:glutathione transferase n=1 Tax=Protea cynaroides TaxID=273540 RepID=A0A9Q0K3G4_9MAGN|nr:hypothetical protein NE237_019988 [Protea cynaroides]